MGPRESGNVLGAPVLLDAGKLELDLQLALSDVKPKDEIVSVDSEAASTPSFSCASSICEIQSTPSSSTSSIEHPRESHLRIGSQLIVPFFIAGMGMVVAGVYLDMVQHWPAFVEMPEIIILVPALLGLKGNLEMTLASRLSTAANMGYMDLHADKVKHIIGNMALIQCQATVVGFLSSVIAVLMVLAVQQEFNLDHTLIMCACSIFTASLASLALGMVTSLVIVSSRFCHVNPDNIATPIAGSLGDITSLVILAGSASVAYDNIDKAYWLCPLVVIAFVSLLPFWIWISKNNPHTRDVLYHGWSPVVMAMLISTFAGLILDIVVGRSSQVAIFQPVVNGVGGNLVAVQASKMSTALHRETKLGTLPPNSRVCISPIMVFFSKRPMAVTARVLMSLVIPGHLAFIYIISYIKTHQASYSAWFLCLYLLSVFLQVATLLYVAYVITSFFWKRKRNPDNSTIPYLTALGDLLGVCLMGVTFEILRLLGKDDVIP